MKNDQATELHETDVRPVKKAWETPTMLKLDTGDAQLSQTPFVDGITAS